MHRRLRSLAVALAVSAFASGLALPALAQEAAIRKAIAERLPDFPKIDEVTKSPIPGLYEIRLGTDILYTDETGTFLVEGSIIDIRSRMNLTEQRVSRLTAIDFKSLPLKDAIVFKQGNGSRKLVVFADPNCGYCKKFEREIAAVKDVTVYTFLYPILGPDSTEKSKTIWCAKDSTKAWRDWMVSGVPATGAEKDEKCDLASLERNMALGRKHKITGTPALVFEDGRKVPGAVPPEQIEKQLAASRKG
jgi:thiol:disulfide interchange protein DsbC